MAIGRYRRRLPAVSIALAAALLGGACGALLGVCGPFTDVSDAGFCPFVLEIFTLGITTGTSLTTYDPASSVTRLQMAAFLSRTVDGTVKRGHRRAAQQRFWNPQNNLVLALTTVGGSPGYIRSDGTDVWVANFSGTVNRVRAGDGKLLESWTGATAAGNVVIAMGRVLVTGYTNPGGLYAIDPTQPAGAVTTVASNLPSGPTAVEFDGARVWTANYLAGSVSIVTPGAVPWTATTVTSGFSAPIDLLYDGANIWTADFGSNLVFRLSPGGAILQTVTVGNNPSRLVFDGTNIWAIAWGGGGSVTVFRASSGSVLRTLTGNGLNGSRGGAFDGERVLVTNTFGDSVSLWRATDLTALGAFPMPTGSFPEGACSDGTNFWIALSFGGKLARF